MRQRQDWLFLCCMENSPRWNYCTPHSLHSQGTIISGWWITFSSLEIPAYLYDYQVPYNIIVSFSFWFLLVLFFFYIFIKIPISRKSFDKIGTEMGLIRNKNYSFGLCLFLDENGSVSPWMMLVGQQLALISLRHLTRLIACRGILHV